MHELRLSDEPFLNSILTVRSRSRTSTFGSASKDNNDYIKKYQVLWRSENNWHTLNCAVARAPLKYPFSTKYSISYNSPKNDRKWSSSDVTWAENDHVINTFAKNFRILNFFEDEINLEEIKYEKIIRGMNSEDQKF